MDFITSKVLTISYSDERINLCLDESFINNFINVHKSYKTQNLCFPAHGISQDFMIFLHGADKTLSIVGLDNNIDWSHIPREVYKKLYRKIKRECGLSK